MVVEVIFSITAPGVFWVLQTIDQLGDYALSPPQFDEVDDVYLDTKKRRLLNAGYCLRQRNRGKGFLLSLFELDLKEGTARKAQKWEIAIKKNKTDPEDWPESQVRKRVLKIISDKSLQPIFVLHQTRITRLIRKCDLVVAQATLDDVSFLVEGDNPHFKLLKITMMVPDVEDHLETITAYLCSKWQLEIEPRSKFEQVIAFELMKRK